MELDLRLVAWLLVNAPQRSDELKSIATMGSGPLEEQQFDHILQALGMEVFLPGEHSEILVLGREGWSERVINEVLDARSGLHLRVYSQEMFFAYLISGRDPLTEEEREIRAMAGDHPGLEFLEAVGFDWPSTQVPPRGSGEIDADLLRLGFLKLKGYTVGKSGLSAAVRRRILIEVYEDQLPKGFPAYYISQWGPPESAKRLKKMADAIAAFCRNNKKKDNAPERAIAEWEADLEWLKRQLYDGHHRFRWPSTDVW